MTCNYNNKIAVELGVNAALAADFIYHTFLNETEMRDGRSWVKCSGLKLSAVYPHMKRRAASRALRKLVEAGVLIRRALNKSSFDSTYFYSVTDYGQKLFEPDRETPPEPIYKRLRQ